MGSVPLRLYNTEFGTEGWDTPLMENPTLISQDAPEFDFVTLVTAVSQAYSKGRYLKFSMVDGNAGEREMTSLGKGSVFSAHQREIKLAFPSLANSTNYEERRTRVVIKRTKSIFKATGRSDRQHDLRSFIHEVHILSQESLHKHANVVSLLGITWHCEQFLSATAVQPQLVLEAADRTLDDLLSSAEDLPFRTRFSLARDVVNGLAAIHACGIVHGDLKTVNILTVGYTAMIADFSHSWVDTGERLRIHVGTRGFMAPEMVRRDIIYDAKALDVYSVGVVLWRTLLKNDDLPRIPEDLDNTRSSELGDDPCLTAALEGMVACVEGDANRPRDNLIREILRATISQDPQNRSLQEVMREMSIFESPDLAEENMFDLEGPLFRPDASSGSSTIFASNHVAFNSTAIFINYQEFIHAPGSVHDQLVACLERISQTPNDPRRARALYELGVCSASQFGNPRQMIPDRSLNFFFEAAKHGDLTAKGYFKRHLELLLPNDGLTSAEVSEMSENTSEWLLEAAVAGHQVAFEDYISGDNRLKKKQNVLDLRAETIFDFQFSTVIDVFKDELKNILGQKKSHIFPMNEQLDTVLHWAAYRDLDIHLQHLLDDVRLDINSLNCHGDTGLMTACMVGNLKAALILLEHGCSVNITNQAGENCLHHIWRFTDDEARYLLSILVDRGIDFEAMAHLPRVYVQGKFIMRTAAETDPFPILHGRPIERMVGRGRTALVNEFLIQGPAIVPRNGNLIRRLILWASTLNFDDTRRLLIQYANDELPTCSWRRGPIHPYLPSIESSIWEHEGINKNYMDSVALGWLSSRGLGWSTPEAFWRMCSHGRLWIKRLHDTIQDISAGLEKPLCHFETSLLHALRSRRPLFCRVYLKIYIDEHGEFNNYQDTRRHHDCKGHKDPQISLSGFDIERGDSDQQALRTRVIDKILFNNDHTLLQLSIITGDRLMFLLLQEFQASLIRPWTGSYSEPPGEYTMERGVKTVERRWRKAYLNCYSILALHSKDIWFAHEFQRFGISHAHLCPQQHPWIWLRRQRHLSSNEDHGVYYSGYLPPLSYALMQGFYYLASFLLSQGANLAEPVDICRNVLDFSLSATCLTQDTARFLFQEEGRYIKPDGTESRISESLLPPDFFVVGKGAGVLRLLADKWKQRPEDSRHGLRALFRTPFSLVPSSTFKYCILLVAEEAQLLGYMAFSVIYHAFREPAREIHRPYWKISNSWILPTVWDNMLERFPDAELTSRWYWNGLTFSKQPSLLEIVLGESNLSVDSTLSPWRRQLSQVLPSHHLHKMRMSTLQHYEKVQTVHRPCLMDLFLYNVSQHRFDHDTGSPSIPDRVYHLGFRHPMSSFLEVSVLLYLLMVAPAVLSAISAPLFKYSPIYMTIFRASAGIQTITCLLFTLITRPFRFHGILAIGMTAGIVYGLRFGELPVHDQDNTGFSIWIFGMELTFGMFSFFAIFLLSCISCSRNTADHFGSTSLLGALLSLSPYNGYRPHQYLDGFMRAFNFKSELRSPLENGSNPVSRSVV